MLRNLKPELSLDTGMINSVSAILFSLGGIDGEHLQQSRSTDYYHSWLAGHLSDFYGGAALTSLALMAAGNNRYLQKLLPTLVVGGLTLDEYFHILNPANTVTDIQDVFCYAAGALISYAFARDVKKGVDWLSALSSQKSS